MCGTLNGVAPDASQNVLADLVERDLVFLDQGEIAGAYPFSSQPTRHAVTICGQRIWAVCALDALGAGAMARSGAHVTTTCPICEARIDVTIGRRGLALRAVSPISAVLWAGVEPIGGCAAATQCQSMLLFCGDDHLQDWCASRSGPNDGYRLTPRQALQAGAAIFRPFLAEPEPEEVSP